MSECIVCKNPLHQIELDLNMNFHRHCSKIVIKEAYGKLWKVPEVPKE